MISYIKKYDDPALKQMCDPVKPEEDVSELIAHMQKALSLEETGVGLAAPQVGVTKRVILVYRSPMINPEIFWTAQMKKVGSEGCLSYPADPSTNWSGYIDIERHVAIKIRYTSPGGKKHEDMLKDFEARIAQHEIDHLNGICLVGDAWRKAQ